MKKIANSLLGVTAALALIGIVTDGYALIAAFGTWIAAGVVMQIEELKK